MEANAAAAAAKKAASDKAAGVAVETEADKTIAAKRLAHENSKKAMVTQEGGVTSPDISGGVANPIA